MRSTLTASVLLTVFISQAQALVTPTHYLAFENVAGLSSGLCLDADRLKTELPFELRDPDDRPIEVDPCDGSKTGYALATALFFLNDLPAVQLPASDFNPNKIVEEPAAFFKGRVQKIILDDRESSDECADGRLAFTKPYWREEKKIWICPAFRNATTVTMTSVLLHEARHLDGQEYDHVVCNEGRMRGQRSCDESYESGAAYGVGLEYLVKLTMNPKLNPSVRREARRQALMEFVSRFNQLPLDLQRGALVQDAKSGAALFYDGTTTVPAGFEAPKDALFMSYGGLPLLYSPEKGTAQIYDFGAKLSDSVSDVLTRTFLDLPSDQKHKLKGVAFGKTEACLLSADDLLCFDKQKNPYSLRAPNSLRLISAETTKVVESGRLYLQTADLYLHAVPDAAAASDLWPKSREPFPFRKGGSWGESWNREEIWLDEKGGLQIFDQTKRSWRPSGTETYRELLTPYVWSKRLKEL